jgi:hypothetical protein
MGIQGLVVFAVGPDQKADPVPDGAARPMR